jgi:hypothetical protein
MNINRKNLSQNIKTSIILAIVSTLLGSNVQASSFGFQSGLAADNLPIGIQLEVDTDDRSSVEAGLSSNLYLTGGYKHFWNTTNHSELFTETSIGAGKIGLNREFPIFSIYVQQGYRWMLNDSTELELKGGLGVVAFQGFGCCTPVSPESAKTNWTYFPLPAIGIRMGFRF